MAQPLHHDYKHTCLFSSCFKNNTAISEKKVRNARLLYFQASDETETTEFVEKCIIDENFICSV